MSAVAELQNYEEPGRGRIHRYAAIGLNLGIVIVVSAVFLLYELEDIERSRLIAEFHLPTAHLAESATHELAHLEIDIRENMGSGRRSDIEHVGVSGPYTVKHTLDDHIYTLSEIQRSLAGRQSDFNVPHFAAVNLLADKAFTALIQRLRAFPAESQAQDVLDDLALLELRLEQLENLNLAAAERLLEEDSPLFEFGERALLFMFVVLAVSASLVTAAIVRRLEIASAERTAAVARMRQASGTLAATTDRLQRAQKLAKMGNWDWHAGTDDLWWSDEFYRLIGLEPQSVPARYETFLDAIHPADRTRAARIIEESESDGIGYDMIFRIVLPDGRERVLREIAEPVIGEDGDFAGHTGTVQDITESIKVESELARIARGLEKAQQIAHVGSWEWDAQTDKHSWSDEAFRVLGLEPGSIVPDGKTFLRYVHPDDLERVKEASLQLSSAGTPLSIEYRIVRADGLERMVNVHAEMEKDEAGAPLRIVGTAQDITERKRIEDELRETAVNLENSQRIAGLGSWVWDIGKNREWWSHEIYRMFGLEVGSVAMDGYGFLEFVHPDDQERVSKINEESIRMGGTFDAEYRICRADGSVIVVHDRGETEYDADGKAIRMRGTTLDITERKKAERKIQEIAENLQEAQRIARLGSWTWSTDEDIEWWSDEVYRIFGIEPGSVILDGFGFLKYVHPDDLERVEELERYATEHERPYSIEYRIVRPDGTVRTVSEQGEPLAGDAAGRRQWRGIVQDITERKAIEEELRDTARELKKSQQIAKLGSWVWDIVEDQEWWSEEIYRIRGMEVEPGPVSGYRYLEKMNPDDRNRVRENLDRSLREGAPYAVEFRVQREDGHEITLLETGETEYDAAGKPVRMRGITQDITERKRIESELERLNAELEQRVEERTAELRDAQAELIKSERLATLGQLTATVSHELRNPLGAMRASMYVVEKSIDRRSGERAVGAVERVNRNISRCDRIIDELLDYTRIRQLEIRPMEIDPWLAEVLDEQPVPEGVHVRRRFGAPGLRVPADADRLRRAVINVYDNACQALTKQWQGSQREAGKQMTIETRLRNNRLEIIIGDNGPGISEDVQDKIFEPLFSTKNFGVGLGLPTVHQIMQQHHGGVTVNSKRGGGAEFTLWLPLETAMEAANR